MEVSKSKGLTSELSEETDGKQTEDPDDPRAFSWSGFLPARAQTWVQTPDSSHSQNALGQIAQVAVGSEAATISRGSPGKSHPSSEIMWPSRKHTQNGKCLLRITRLTKFS